MSSKTNDITVIVPLQAASSPEARSDETLRPSVASIVQSNPPKVVEKSSLATAPAVPTPKALLSSPRPTGVLRHERVSLSHSSTGSNVPRQVIINGIPLAGIMFLDLANSADFPANVFNELPVPTFAMILMAIGASFALFMSGVAFFDARRSWHAIQLLRAEQNELRTKAAARNQSTSEEKGETGADPTIESFLHLNRRDVGTEFFERFGMEVFMGGAAFIISIGTYMAIAGDNPTVYQASNLISGYIGNAPAAFYGLINTGWSIIISLRARRQRKAALTLKGSVHARGALIRRASLIQVHSAFSGLSCLVSGALGMVTPTEWQPYPALAVLGLLFMYTVHLFRNKISYKRAPLTLHAGDVTTADLVHEIDELLTLRSKIIATKSKGEKKRKHIVFDKQSLEEQLQKLLLCGLFERFCAELMELGQGGAASVPCTQVVTLIKERQLEEVTPSQILRLADEVHTSSETEDPDELPQESIYQALGQWCEHLLRRKAILRRISMRSRFLLELLGSHLITFPHDRTVYIKTA